MMTVLRPQVQFSNENFKAGSILSRNLRQEGRPRRLKNLVEGVRLELTSFLLGPASVALRLPYRAGKPQQLKTFVVPTTGIH